MNSLINLTPEFIENLINEAKLDIQHYPYNQYRHYPAQIKDGWLNIFRETLMSMLKSNEWTFFGGKHEQDFILVGCRISNWDKDHFGFPIAGLRVLFSSMPRRDENYKSEILSDCVAFLKETGVTFCGARIHGDDLSSIHILENLGFRYYENIIWPVLNTRSIQDTIPGNVRLMKPEDLERVRFIASNFQYERGHFHCDDRFPKNLVNTMYAKWVETAFNRNGTVAVIESEDDIVGYFVYEMDHALSKHLGYSYGRLQSLALDQSVRGMGIGKQLFEGTIVLIKLSGGQYIDSGYASKNFPSSKIHVNCNFIPFYEEITLHKWL